MPGSHPKRGVAPAPSALDNGGSWKASPRMHTPPPTDAAHYVSPRHQPMRFGEFVIVVASLMALVSLATSMMLAVLAEIGRTFGVQPNQTQSVLTAFFAAFS